MQHQWSLLESALLWVGSHFCSGLKRGKRILPRVRAFRQRRMTSRCSVSASPPSSLAAGPSASLPRFGVPLRLDRDECDEWLVFDKMDGTNEHAIFTSRDEPPHTHEWRVVEARFGMALEVGGRRGIGDEPLDGHHVPCTPDTPST